MGMRINTNVEAFTAQRNLQATSASYAKSIEKLSSGLRINRAGDDAAGLSISEKLRSQTRGLAQAQRNAQDGISLIQTGEGALNETHSILQRMDELAVQASNGTLSSDDQKAIAAELVQLQDAIDDIGNHTQFNGLKLLAGSGGASGGSGGSGGSTVSQSGGTAQVGLNLGHGGQIAAVDVSGAQPNAIYTLSAGSGSSDLVLSDGTHTQTVTLPFRYTGPFTISFNQLGVNLTIAGAMGYGNMLRNDLNGLDITTTNGASQPSLSGNVQFTSGGPATYNGAGASQPDADNHSVVITPGTSNSVDGTYVVTVTGVDPMHADPGSVSVTKNGVPLTGVSYTPASSAVYGADNVNFGNGVQFGFYNHQQAAVGDTYTFTISGGPAPSSSSASSSINLQTGANAGEQLSVALKDMRSSAIGSTGSASSLAAAIAAFSTDANASASSSQLHTDAQTLLQSIQQAVTDVSAQRAVFGASQNRLEHTIANLGVAQENTMSAESRIRDVDMASEMVDFTKTGILQQAGQAILAQANQSGQGVLSLLRG